MWLIRDDNSPYMPCKSLLSGTEPSTLGLRNLKRFEVELSLSTSKEDPDALLKYLLVTCAKCSGG